MDDRGQIEGRFVFTLQEAKGCHSLPLDGTVTTVPDTSADELPRNVEREEGLHPNLGQLGGQEGVDQVVLGN